MFWWDKAVYHGPWPEGYWDIEKMDASCFHNVAFHSFPHTTQNFAPFFNMVRDIIRLDKLIKQAPVV